MLLAVCAVFLPSRVKSLHWKHCLPPLCTSHVGLMWRYCRHEFVPRSGGPPEFRYCQGVNDCHCSTNLAVFEVIFMKQANGSSRWRIASSMIFLLQKELFGRNCLLWNDNGLRFWGSECYRMQIVSKDGTRRNVVAKVNLQNSSSISGKNEFFIADLQGPRWRQEYLLQRCSGSCDECLFGPFAVHIWFMIGTNVC